MAPDSQLALDVNARGKFMLGAAMLAIGASPFGLEHGALSFEQGAQVGAQIGRKLCETGRIEALRHVSESIACAAPIEANPSD